METYKEITLLRGDKVQIQIARGIHYSTANMLMGMHNAVEDVKLDALPFLMNVMCRVNNESYKGVGYYVNLLADDYLLIMESMSEQIESLNIDSDT